MVRTITRLLLPLALLASAPLLRAQAPSDTPDKEKLVVQNLLVEAVSKLDTAPAEAMQILQYLDRHYSPDDAVKYYLGLAAWSAGRMEDAEAYLLQACSLDTANYWYKDALASVYSAEGKGLASATVYLDLLEKQPSHHSGRLG